MPKSFLDSSDFTLTNQDEFGDLLLAEILICGVPHHANFYRVKRVELGWEAMSAEWDGDIDLIQELSGTDGHLMTFELPDREGEWICCIWPYNQ